MAIKKKNNIKKVPKNLEYYLNLPWTYSIETDVDTKGNRHYVVRVNELPGVCTDAPTIPKAMEEIKEAMLLAFEMYLAAGEEIPQPVDESKFQGNIAYRTTSRRHYIIAKEAEKRGQSLSRVIDDFIDVAAETLRKK